MEIALLLLLVNVVSLDSWVLHYKVISREGYPVRGISHWICSPTGPSFTIRSASNNDIDDSEERVVSEEELRRIWRASGQSMSAYNSQQAALLLLTSEEEDEENDEEGVSISMKDLSISEMKRQLSFKSRNSVNNGNDLPTPVRVREKSVGIDLGTTFSSISLIERGAPKILSIDSSTLVPSIVTYLPTSTPPLVGELARQQLITNDKNTFSSVKRVIGATFAQAKKNGEKLSLLKVDAQASLASNDSMCLFKVPALKNQLLRPEEISSQVVAYLLKEATNYLNANNSESVNGDTHTKITRAVITVPAYFKPIQCKATERAGYLAGLTKVKLLREPEAAALAYGLNRKKPQIILVIDLGGGTFDCSVLDVGGGVVEVLFYSSS